MQSTTDPCLYVKNDKADRIFFIIYVDDFSIVAKNIRMIDWTAEFLRAHFQLIRPWGTEALSWHPDKKRQCWVFFVSKKQNI